MSKRTETIEQIATTARMVRNSHMTWPGRRCMPVRYWVALAKVDARAATDQQQERP
jgi:hypothetical protein